MKHFLCLIVALLTMNNCFASEDYIAMVDRLVNAYDKQMRKEYGLRLAGSGGGFMNDVNCISLYYEATQSVDDANARRVLVDCVEKLLCRINSDKKLRPYLHNYPFTAYNLDICISFRTPRDDRPDSRYVALVSVFKGQVISPHYDSKRKEFFGDNPEQYEETYAKVRAF
jgi:hypothetical protein